MPRNKKSRIRTPPVTAVLNAAELSSGFLAFPSGECQHKRLQALRPRLTPGLPKFSVLRGCSRLLVLSYTVRDAKGVIRWRGADFSAWPPGPCTGIILPNLALPCKCPNGHKNGICVCFYPKSAISCRDCPMYFPKVCALHQQKVTNLCLLTRAKQTLVG